MGFGGFGNGLDFFLTLLGLLGVNLLILPLLSGSLLTGNPLFSNFFLPRLVTLLVALRCCVATRVAPNLKSCALPLLKRRYLLSPGLIISRTLLLIPFLASFLAFLEVSTTLITPLRFCLTAILVDFFLPPVGLAGFPLPGYFFGGSGYPACLNALLASFLPPSLLIWLKFRYLVFPLSGPDLMVYATNQTGSALPFLSNTYLTLAVLTFGFGFCLTGPVPVSSGVLSPGGGASSVT